MKRKSSPAKTKYPNGRSRGIDQKAIELIRSSGILSRDATLDEILKMAEVMNIEVADGVQAGTIFIFRGFAFVASKF
jgi:hypothetical protein